MTRDSYIPKNSVISCLERTDLNAVVYVLKDRHQAMAFSGKRAKYDWFYRFNSEAERDKRIAAYFEGLEAKKTYRTEQKLSEKAKTKEFLEKLKPGVILYSSWGYDQTNIDFYKVLARKGSRVILAEIGSKSVRSTGWASDVVVADPEFETGKVFTKSVRSPYISFESYSSAHLWDGKELHRSWYA